MFGPSYPLKCLGADCAFKTFEQERERILERAASGKKIWDDSSSDLISSDLLCMHDECCSLKRTHKCVKCRAYDAFKPDDGEGVLDVQVTGEKYLISRYPSIPHTTVVSTHNEGYDNILRSNARSCCGLDGVGSKISLFYGSDAFTNMLIISYLLERSVGLATYKKIVTGNVCGGSDVIVHEKTDGNIQPELMSLDDCITLVEQLVVTLYVLQANFQFSHGNPTYKSIEVSSAPSSVVHEEKTFSWTKTYKLCELFNSSITVEGTRYYSANERTDTLLSERPFQPSVMKTSSATPSGGVVDWYTINKNTRDMLTSYIRHMGSPFYLSFDLYSFIVSLMTFPNFRTHMMSDRVLNNIWRAMWSPDDLDKMDRRCMLPFGYTHLQDVKLRCDLPKILFNILDK